MEAFNTSSCSQVWWSIAALNDTNEFEGPLGLNYLHFFSCELKVLPVLSFTLLVLYTLYVLYILGSTAELYFSPALSGVCESLNLSQEVAGVTLLACGNGAPDVFSCIAAFDSSPGLGLGALLGGGIFVTTVVFGTVCIAAENHVVLSPKSFKRDAGYLSGVIVFLALIGVLFGAVNLFLSVLFMVIYAIFVGVVLYQSRQRGNQPSTGGITHAADSQQDEEEGSGVVSGFVESNESVGEYSTVVESDQGLEYSFATLSASEMPSALRETESTGGLEMSELSRTRHQKPVPSASLEQHVVENHFGSARSSSISSQEEYLRVGDSGQRNGWYSPFTGLFSSDLSVLKPRPRQASLVDVDNDEGRSASLSVSLLAGEVEDTTSDASQYRNIDELIAAQNDGRTTNMLMKWPPGLKRPPNIWQGLFWQRMMFRKGLRRKLLPDPGWMQLPKHRLLLTVLEWPFVVLRTLTIPSVEPGSWSKPVAILQPLLCTLFVLQVAQLGSGINIHPSVWGLTIPGSLLLSCVLYFMLYNSKPPSNKYAVLSFLSVAFVCCVCWIFLIASELVAVIATLGHVLNVPPALLGMTALAWGNSMGDFAANLAVAKDGFPNMALAGCFGTPIFNILVGLGMSLLMVTFGRYPEIATFQLDVYAWIGVLFFLCGLGMNVALAHRNGYVISKLHSRALLLLYTIFVLICVLVAVV